MKNIILILLAFIFTACNLNSNKKIIESKQNSMEIINKSEDQWKKELSQEQYKILREKGTEAPNTGKLLHNKENGNYVCAGCGNELFSDEMKFDSDCGWPSFDKEIEGGKIKKIEDLSHGMVRTEIICAKCGGHLGHLFNDGPTKTGLRYCVNSLSLDFKPKNKIQQKQTIILGGGCFWCIEAIYLNLKGVEKVESGYSGGITKNPTYKEVSSGVTNHAEVIKITYNPKEISLEEILEVFFSVHDPTSLNKQGEDV